MTVCKKSTQLITYRVKNKCLGKVIQCSTIYAFNHRREGMSYGLI